MQSYVKSEWGLETEFITIGSVFAGIYDGHRLSAVVIVWF